MPASITAMDDEIGRVVAALDKKGMRDNTLIVFQSDNGGTRNAMFAGEEDMSKIKIPCDNGPYRDGKGSLYEGGTRVVALANWPGPHQAGQHRRRDDPRRRHVSDARRPRRRVDRQEQAARRHGRLADDQRRQASPRTEIVYNVEPFRAGVRQGDWKLIWRTPLPQAVELYNIAQDPSEKNNVAAQPGQGRRACRSAPTSWPPTMAKPLMLTTEFAGDEEAPQPAAGPSRRGDALRRRGGAVAAGPRVGQGEQPR